MNEFLLHMKRSKLGLIAEVKLRSPKEGVLGTMADFEKRIAVYEKSGADAISLVVEETKFGGSLEMISKAKKATHLPILVKDFIRNTHRLKEIKKVGADTVLLIAKIVSPQILNELVLYAQELQLEPVVEIFNEFELKSTLKTTTNIIAVNARNLNNFSINVAKACTLLELIPKSYIRLGFSGVQTRSDILKYKQAGVNAVLVGTVLMRSKKPAQLIKELKGI